MRMHLTKTICTLGPATSSEEGIRNLAERGMSIARMNFSHGSQETHSVVVQSIRAVNAAGGFNVGLLLDTKGAEIRTGDRPEPLQVNAGDTVTFSYAKETDEHPVIKVSYPDFWKDAKHARFILIDSGELMMDIVSIEEDRVVAKSQGAYGIGSRRHINLPGANVTLPSLAEKDWSDIELGCRLKLDYIALSFIRKGSEVREVREFVKKHGHPDIVLISKIENGIGVENIDDIIEASDGIMIARGDLGAEIPLETLPWIQDDIAARCRKAGKPVIMATQMLESMIKNPMPTRAEVTDVAHAASIGVDSTMLSGETAAGKYPYVALEMMIRIVNEAERHLPRSKAKALGSSDAEKQAAEALKTAQSEKAAAIIVHSKTGATARALSRLRPHVPVLMASEDADMLRRHQLHFALQPLQLASGANAVALAVQKELVASGEKVVIVDSGGIKTVNA
jgi:pyruvate kinase